MTERYFARVQHERISIQVGAKPPALARFGPTQVPCLYFELERPSVIRGRRGLVWDDLGANIVYIGRLANERHQRIWSFRGAVIP